MRKYNNAAKNLAAEIPYEKQWTITAAMGLYEKLKPNVPDINFFTAMGALFSMKSNTPVEKQLYYEARALFEITDYEVQIAATLFHKDIAKLINTFLVNETYRKNMSLNFWNFVPHDIFSYSIIIEEEFCTFSMEFSVVEGSYTGFTINQPMHVVAPFLALLFTSKLSNKR